MDDAIDTHQLPVVSHNSFERVWRVWCPASEYAFCEHFVILTLFHVPWISIYQIDYQVR